eukprot:m.102905 g.102905  ORF g.102905 m.102905 type:complete len:295 (+) comp27448_c0_seq4:329-1213(+)
MQTLAQCTRRFGPQPQLIRFETVEMPNPDPSSSKALAAIITLCGSNADVLPWGTPKREHRLNPWLMAELSHALEEAIKLNCSCVLVTGEGKFWSNGLDLKYLDTLQTEGEVDAVVDLANSIMVTLLQFPIPTICVANGHWCAAGGMLALTFDFRLMNAERGFFFIPGVDLGLEYSPFQLKLMMVKLPEPLHRDVIMLNRKRFKAAELQSLGIVEATSKPDQLLQTALEFATTVHRVGGAETRAALCTIKKQVHARITDVLVDVRNGGKMVLNTRHRGVDRAAPRSRQHRRHRRA